MNISLTLIFIKFKKTFDQGLIICKKETSKLLKSINLK